MGVKLHFTSISSQRHGRDLPLVTSGAVLWQKGCRPGVSARKSPTARSPQPGRGREVADTAPRAQDLHNRAPGLGRGDFTTVPGQAAFRGALRPLWGREWDSGSDTEPQESCSH